MPHVGNHHAPMHHGCDFQKNGAHDTAIQQETTNRSVHVFPSEKRGFRFVDFYGHTKQVFVFPNTLRVCNVFLKCCGLVMFALQSALPRSGGKRADRVCVSALCNKCSSDHTKCAGSLTHLKEFERVNVQNGRKKRRPK